MYKYNSFHKNNSIYIHFIIYSRSLLFCFASTALVIQSSPLPVKTIFPLLRELFFSGSQNGWKTCILTQLDFYLNLNRPFFIPRKLFTGAIRTVESYIHFFRHRGRPLITRGHNFPPESQPFLCGGCTKFNNTRKKWAFSICGASR